MSAEKMSRKELLKSEDEFLTLSGRAALFVSGHTRQFRYLGVAVAVVLLLYLGVQTYFNYVERKGQAAYNDAFYALADWSRGKPDLEKMKNLEDLFRKVTEEHGLAKVSHLAYAELAYLKFRERKYDEAISLYQQFLKEAQQPGAYASLAMLSLAACYEEKGELEKAAEMLKKVLAQPQEPFREQATFSLARIYAMSQQTDKAKETLKEFVAQFKDSPLLPMAKAHLKKYTS